MVESCVMRRVPVPVWPRPRVSRFGRRRRPYPSSRQSRPSMHLHVPRGRCSPRASKGQLPTLARTSTETSTRIRTDRSTEQAERAGHRDRHAHTTRTPVDSKDLDRGLESEATCPCFAHASRNGPCGHHSTPLHRPGNDGCANTPRDNLAVLLASTLAVFHGPERRQRQLPGEAALRKRMGSCVEERKHCQSGRGRCCGAWKTANVEASERTRAM